MRHAVLVQQTLDTGAQLPLGQVAQEIIRAIAFAAAALCADAIYAHGPYIAVGIHNTLLAKTGLVAIRGRGLLTLLISAALGLGLAESILAYTSRTIFIRETLDTGTLVRTKRSIAVVAILVTSAKAHIYALAIYASGTIGIAVTVIETLHMDTRWLIQTIVA